MKIRPGKVTTGINSRNYNAKILVAFLFIFIYSHSSSQTNWFRGNMHTHSLWSDGDEFPENVARWYKENGYDFLVLSEGNTIPEGERWQDFQENNGILQNYIKDYGEEWVDMHSHAEEEDTIQVRLKTFEEFRSRYEEPGKFLLIMGNEISNAQAVHLLAFQQDRIIPAIQGNLEDREYMIRKTVENVEEYGKETGRNVHAVLTHPNYNWAITAEMMINVPELRYFEVYNGHPSVKNEGNENRAGTDRMWDIVLSKRLSSGSGEILYGMATDDAHNYHGGRSGPGRGWIMVRSEVLTTKALFDAIDKGDFYASTGIFLKSLQFDGNTLNIEISGQENVEYLTEFIGTLKGTDMNGKPTTDSDGNIIENTTQTYSSDIGRVLAASRSINPFYTFTGKELYVRARITSTADHIDPNSGNLLGKQKVWVQPYIQKTKK